MIGRCVAVAVVLLLSFPATAEEFLDKPLDSLNVTQGWKYNSGKLHRGIDYRARSPQPVFAAEDGLAATADHWCFVDPAQSRCEGLEDNNYGKFILVIHDNNTSAIYAHLSSTVGIFSATESDIRAGQTQDWTFVRKGDLIGYTGITGTDNFHLHFELARNTSGNYGGHIDGKRDPYDLRKLARFYPPVGTSFQGCGDAQAWIRSDQTCPEAGGPVTLSFRGEVFFAGAGPSGRIPGNIEAGDSVRGEIQYTPATARSEQGTDGPGDDFTRYLINDGRYQFRINGVTWRSDSFGLSIYDDPTVSGFFGDSIFVSQAFVDSGPGDRMRGQFFSDSATFLESNRLPTSDDDINLRGVSGDLFSGGADFGIGPSGPSDDSWRIRFSIDPNSIRIESQ